MSGGVLEEVVGKGDPPWFEEGDGARPPEGKIAPLVTSRDWVVGHEGLPDGTDVGGADVNCEDGAEVLRFEFGDDPLVLPEVGEVPPKGDG